MATAMGAIFYGNEVTARLLSSVHAIFSKITSALGTAHQQQRQEAQRLDETLPEGVQFI